MIAYAGDPRRNALNPLIPLRRKKTSAIRATNPLADADNPLGILSADLDSAPTTSLWYSGSQAYWSWSKVSNYESWASAADTARSIAHRT